MKLRASWPNVDSVVSALALLNNPPTRNTTSMLQHLGAVLHLEVKLVFSVNKSGIADAKADPTLPGSVT